MRQFVAAQPRWRSAGAGAVRTLRLGGLGVDEAQVLLAPKRLDGTGQQWAELNARFGGNGPALNVVAESIRERFSAARSVPCWRARVHCTAPNQHRHLITIPPPEVNVDNSCSESLENSPSSWPC